MSTPTTPTSKTIEITVSPEGSVSVKTNGFSGSSCRDATRELERALGISSRETLLPEFHAHGQAETRIQQGQ
jgi:hypothetical protein